MSTGESQGITRRSMLLATTGLAAAACTTGCERQGQDSSAAQQVASAQASETSSPPLAASAQTGSLASWNDGPAKSAILDFVSATTDKSNANFVQVEDRIATFDQDGTLWTEHP